MLECKKKIQVLGHQLQVQFFFDEIFIYLFILIVFIVNMFEYIFNLCVCMTPVSILFAYK